MKPEEKSQKRGEGKGNLVKESPRS